MHNEYMVHAIEGVMVSTKNGILKLLDLFKKGKESHQIFVISPVTDNELSLTGLLERAENKDERLWAVIERSRNSWLELSENSLESDVTSFVTEAINASFAKVEDILKAVWLLEKSSEQSRIYLESMTSFFIASILSALFEAEGRNASMFSVEEAVRRDVFPQGASFIYGKLLEPETERKDALGRVRAEGESEYTASIIASNITSPLTFWNHRSLLRTASIKDVPSAKVIKNLSYAEATELSFFGAPIVHPHSFIPAEAKGLTIRLRFWGDVDDEGTLVSKEVIKDKDKAVKAFSVVRNVSLINVEGSGMSGVPGVSSRLFTALRNEKISVIFISQASSEYSICFAVPKSDSAGALRTIKKEFSEELGKKAINSIEVENDCAILAAVGEEMPGAIGVAGKFFSSLAKSNINIRAIAQGSSERNISAVIKMADSAKALRSLHSGFFMSAQTLSVGLFGPGNIGGTLLNQIARESERLRAEFDLDIRIRGIATSKRMLLSDEGIDLSSWKESFEKYSVVYNEKIFMEHIGATYYPHKVIIDCTSSLERALTYKELLDAGFHIITPNKKANSASYDYYKSLIETSRRTGSKYYYETTVGAGLPIITTLKDLRETGDDILKVEGMVSGTLAWLFSQYDGRTPFSALVLKAKEMGFTEPDPRDDLSGMDVARKTVILAREMGYETEVEDIQIRSLVPDYLKDASKEEFLSRLSEMDEEMLKLYSDAKKEGRNIRYVGKVGEDGICSVGLELYDEDHPFSQADGTDNVIAFTTRRYYSQPLVIKGPGAGPEVTAAGVFADMLRLGAYLGSRI